MIPKLKALYFSLCLSIIIAFFSYHAYAIYAFGQLHHDRAADTVIVLGASVNQHQPSPVFKQRIHHAMTLFKQNKAKRIIFTGGVSTGSHLSESEIAQAYALKSGIPANAMLIEKTSTITFENLAEAQKIMHSKGLTSALVVSDPLHMKRAMTMADDLGLNAMPAPTPTTLYRSWQTKLPFLAREVYFYLGYQIASFIGLQ